MYNHLLLYIVLSWVYHYSIMVLSFHHGVLISWTKTETNGLALSAIRLLSGLGSQNRSIKNNSKKWNSISNIWRENLSKK